MKGKNTPPGSTISPANNQPVPGRQQLRRRLIPGMALALTALAAVFQPDDTAAQANPPNNEEQNQAAERRGNPAFWQAELRGGHYMVRLDRVASISRHEYVVDAVARVVEITVATNSSAIARFYYLEPVTAGGSLNIGREASARVRETVDEVSRRGTGQSAAQVVKNYPTSTHAHTVEYVITSVAQLDSLYNSLRDAIETGRGRVWVGTGG